WVSQKYWQETAVPLPWFGVLLAGYNLIDGVAAKYAALAATRYGRRPWLAVVGVLPIVAYFGMAAFFGWAGILFGFVFKIGRGVLGVLFMEALNERIPSALRVPGDRDLAVAARTPRLLLPAGASRGLWD